MRSFKIVLLSVVLGVASYATTISFSTPPTTDTGWNACGSYPGYTCDTTAYFNPESLNTLYDNGLGTLFENAFNAWNDAGGGKGWTLDNGGSLTGTFNVTTAQAQQFQGVTRGGLTIEISVANVTLPNLKPGEKLVWVQGLYDNYELVNGVSKVVAPFYEMDTTSATNPSYTDSFPPQPPGPGFYDQPKARYQPPGTTQIFFDANTYLGVENLWDKTLTVYDGVSYGFENFVSPEPGTWMLCGGGLLIVIFLRRNVQWRKCGCALYLQVSYVRAFLRK